MSCILGVEVNFYALTSPLDFKHFVSLYNGIKATINEKYPETKVLVTFHYELMFGKYRYWPVPTLPKIVRYFDVDILGISTYACLSVNDAREIPEDYYSPFEQRSGYADDRGTVGPAGEAQQAPDSGKGRTLQPGP
jgi:hypothetical protein